MVSAVLVMAGNASRMNINENKVFLPLGDKKVFEHSLNTFLDLGLEVICVIRPEDESLLKDYNVKIAYGGKTRQESVYNGLKLVSKKYALIHDAARPFISKENVLDCIKALKAGNGVLVGESIKNSIYEKKPLKSLKRDELISAQTPQGAEVKVLLECHMKAIEDKYLATDDISLLLKYSDTNVCIIEGNDTNFKITTQLDYILAKELVKHD